MLQRSYTAKVSVFFTQNEPNLGGRKAETFNPKTEVGEHARPGRCWIRPRIQPFGVRKTSQIWNFSERTVFSAMARKTAPGAGALPLLSCEIRGRGREQEYFGDMTPLAAPDMIANPYE
jgi:hypothetical protein